MSTNEGKAVLFDLDGTLFQTERVAVPAFHRTCERLEKEGMYQGPRPSDEEVTSVFGMTPSDIWDRLLPEASEQVRRTADGWWLQDELDCLAEGMGELYPGVAEGLEVLHGRGWRLFVASNGLGPYVRGVLRYFDLSPLFEGIYSAGEQKISRKEHLVAKLMAEHGVNSGWMVGDRSSDVRAGKANGLQVLGCRYTGFPRFSDGNELNGADQIIHSFSELLPLVGDPASKE